MTTSLMRRIERLENAMLPPPRRDVLDPSELTDAELSLILLDDFAAFRDDASLADLHAQISAATFLVDERVSDPMERFAAHLLRTVIWGGDCDWMTGRIAGALPRVAEQYRKHFPERVFAVAETAPPWGTNARIS